jgi:hypothetical protein
MLVGLDYKLQITNYKFQQFSGRRCCSKKDLVIAQSGVARSEVRALSGAGTDGLVALETWQCGGEITNIK